MKVLIAIDESECSSMALDSVAGRHWGDEGQFRIVSVFEPLAYQAAGWHAAYMPVSMIEAEQKLVNSKRKFVDDKVAELKKAFGADKVTGSVLEGPVWPSVIEEAKSWEADLIVVGSHGRSGLNRLFLGSVAEAIASHANCSVEIVKGHAPVECNAGA